MLFSKHRLSYISPCFVQIPCAFLCGSISPRLSSARLFACSRTIESASVRIMRLNHLTQLIILKAAIRKGIKGRGGSGRNMVKDKRWPADGLLCEPWDSLCRIHIRGAQQGCLGEERSLSGGGFFIQHDSSCLRLCGTVLCDEQTTLLVTLKQALHRARVPR